MLIRRLEENKVELTRPIREAIKLFRIALRFAGTKGGGILPNHHLRELQKLLPPSNDVKEIVQLLEECIQNASYYSEADLIMSNLSE